MIFSSLQHYYNPISVTNALQISKKKKYIFTNVKENTYYTYKDYQDSMMPRFNDGDKVYVVNQQSVEIGEIGIFVINGDAYIKKLGKGQLISLNEKYKPISLHNDDCIYCCGKVIGVVEK